MKKNKTLYLAIILAAVLWSGCKKDDNPTSETGTTDYSKLLTDYTDNVVLNTYGKLKNKTADLQAACTLLAANPVQANLDAAAEAWRQAREPWEQSEGFLFGPVSVYSLDPSMDTWPLDENQLHSVLSGSFELNPEFIRNGLGFSLRGFHTVEYFLFKDGNNRPAGELTQREKEYIVAAATVLAEDAAALYSYWLDGYAKEFKSAGKAGSRYASQSQAVQEILEGMITIADEVGNGKISEPFVTKDVMTVESQFSWNSLTDFSNNVISIKNAYRGYATSGTGSTGLEQYVAQKNSALNQKVLTQIDAAIIAISAIPEPFRNNLGAATQIQAAIDACNALLNTLQTEVKPLLGQN